MPTNLLCPCTLVVVGGAIRWSDISWQGGLTLTIGCPFICLQISCRAQKERSLIPSCHMASPAQLEIRPCRFLRFSVDSRVTPDYDVSTHRSQGIFFRLESISFDINFVWASSLVIESIQCIECRKGPNVCMFRPIRRQKISNVFQCSPHLFLIFMGMSPLDSMSIS